MGTMMREVKPFVTRSHLADAINFSFDKCGISDGESVGISKKRLAMNRSRSDPRYIALRVDDTWLERVTFFTHCI